jgi:hypothetical protein
MKKLTILILSFWVGAASAAEIGPSARQTFYRWCEQLEKGDLDQARKIMLSAEELGSFARWQFDRERYRLRLEEFLRGMSEELKNYSRLVRADAADALVMPPDGKISRQVIMVVIHAYFEPRQQKVREKPQAAPFYLILHGGQWKIWLR